MRSQSETVRLAELKEERAVLERRKAGLLRQLAEVEVEMRQNDIEQAEFAPVYMLPEDVLKQIFEETYTHDPIDGPCQLEPSLSLIPLQVSRRWRYTALFLPRIWRCIHLDMPVPFVEHCLRQLPPHSPVLISNIAHTLASDRCTKSLDLLLNHSWLFYDVQSDDQALILILTRALDNADTSSLHHLSVEHVRNVTYPHLMYDGNILVPTSTRCSYLALRGVEVSLSLPLLANLRSLVLGSYTLSDEDFQKIATAAPKLEELTLDTLHASGGATTSRVVNFPHLTTLKFILMDWYNQFTYFELPKLHTISSFMTPIADSDDLVSAKIFTSVRHFQYIQCIAESVGYDELVFDGGIFRRYPDVTALDLIDCTNISHIVDYLAYDDDADDVLPKLEVLSFELAWTTLEEADIDPQSILELVERRVNSGSPFKELRLGQETRGDLGPYVLDQLAQLVKVSDRPLTREEKAIGESLRRRDSS